MKTLKIFRVKFFKKPPMLIAAQNTVEAVSSAIGVMRTLFPGITFSLDDVESFSLAEEQVHVQ